MIKIRILSVLLGIAVAECYIIFICKKNKKYIIPFILINLLLLILLLTNY